MQHKKRRISLKFNVEVLMRAYGYKKTMSLIKTWLLPCVSMALLAGCASGAPTAAPNTVWNGVHYEMHNGTVGNLGPTGGIF